MQCEFHPQRVAVGRCHKCGKRFCVECAEETGQTRLCKRCMPESIRKKEEVDQAVRAPVPEAPAQATATPPAVEKKEAPAAAHGMPAPTPPVAAAKEETKKEETKKKETKKEETKKEEEGEGFLAQGPDYDFSELKREQRKSAFTRPAAPTTKSAAKPTASATPEAATPEPAPLQGGTPPPASSLDLDDVLASLVDTSAMVPVAGGRGGYSEAEESGEMALEKPGKERARELKEQRREERQRSRVERAERWDFLSQPRSSEETHITATKPRAVLFIFAAWLLTAILWAVPNAYLPFWPFAGDKESLLWALIVGAATGLLFWWKAGKKHSTKLAVQSGLVALFGLMGGEFLLWALIILKERAFRTVFIDIISFKFIWEYGGEILADMAKAMFPAMFLVILLLPAAVAFVIGYGMPPIPEIFFELKWALRGRSKPGKEHA